MPPKIFHGQSISIIQPDPPKKIEGRYGGDFVRISWENGTSILLGHAALKAATEFFKKKVPDQ